MLYTSWVVNSTVKGRGIKAENDGVAGGVVSTPKSGKKNNGIIKKQGDLQSKMELRGKLVLQMSKRDEG